MIQPNREDRLSLEISESLDRAIAQREDFAVTVLTDLLNAPSVSGQEAECQRRVAFWMNELGATVRQVPIDEAALSQVHGYLKSPLPYDGRLNIIGEWPGRSNRPSLILNSHADVVEAGDTKRWNTDPWKPALRDGRIYGRGSTDAKGCLTAALLAVAAIADAGIEFEGSVMVQSVVDEEETGNGTLECLRRGITADAAIVLEPTDLEICTGQRGVRGVRLMTQGLPAHAGGGGGRSAITLAAKLIEQLDALNTSWPKEFAANGFLPPRLNVGQIHGGESIFTVAGECELLLGIRYAPGQIDSLLDSIRMIANRVAESGDKPASVSFEEYYDVAAMRCDERLRFVELLLQAASQTLGRKVESKRFQAGCDARHFDHFGVPAVIFGPGSIDRAHSPNEYVEIAEIATAAKLLATFMVSYWH